MTLYGVVANGVHYVSGCASRFGPYPDCAVLDLPSYSLAKSIVAGLGTMRLNLLYPGVTNEFVARYVPECARTKGWDDVTFANLLDMGAGISTRRSIRRMKARPILHLFSLPKITQRASPSPVRTIRARRRREPSGFITLLTAICWERRFLPITARKPEAILRRRTCRGNMAKAYAQPASLCRAANL